MITALMFNPGEHPQLVHLLDNGPYLNQLVSIGSDLRCTARDMYVGKGVLAVYAEEGITFGLLPNRKVGKRIMAGTFYIVGEKDGNLRSLTLEEIIKYGKRHWDPEDYTEDEVINSWFDGLYPVL